jgi:hypothetical protein
MFPWGWCCRRTETCRDVAKAFYKGYIILCILIFVHQLVCGTCYSPTDCLFTSYVALLRHLLSSVSLAQLHHIASFVCHCYTVFFCVIPSATELPNEVVVQMVKPLTRFPYISVTNLCFLTRLFRVFTHHIQQITGAFFTTVFGLS